MEGVVSINTGSIVFCDQERSLQERFLNNNGIKSCNTTEHQSYVCEGPNKIKVDITKSIATIENVVTQYKQKLITLIAINMKISKLDESTFKEATQLKQICLENNIISEISYNALENLQKLEELHLANNNLKNLEYGTFATLQNLKVLWLDNNNILNLDGSHFSKNTKLIDLRVNYNLIISLTYSDVKNLDQNTKFTSTHDNLADVAEYVRKCDNSSIISLAACVSESISLKIDTELHKILQIFLLGLITFLMMILTVVAMNFSCKYKHKNDILPRTHQVGDEIREIIIKKDSTVEQANNAYNRNSIATIFSDPIEMYPCESFYIKPECSLFKISEQIELNDMEPSTYAVSNDDKNCTQLNEKISGYSTINRNKKANEESKKSEALAQNEECVVYSQIRPHSEMRPENIYHEIK